MDGKPPGHYASRTLMAGALAGWSAFAVLRVLVPGSPAGMAVADALAASAFACLALLCRQAAATRFGWERSAWHWFQAGAWLLALQVALVGHSKLLWPELTADIGNRSLNPLALQVIFVVGLLHLARRWAPDRSVTTMALDALLTAGAVFFVLWGAVYRDLYETSPLPVDERFEIMLYTPLAAALVVTALVAVVIGRPRPPRGYWLLAGALGLGILFEGIDAVLELGGVAWGAAVGDVGVAVLGGITAVAACQVGGQPPWVRPPSSPPPRASQVLPLAVLMAAVLSAGWSWLEHGGLSGLQFWLAFALMLILLLRTTLTVLAVIVLESNLRRSVAGRTRLLRFVTHELGNPLVPLGLQLKLVEPGLRAQGHGQALAIMSRSMQRLERLSQDVRDQALAENGRLLKAPQETDLVQLVRAAMQAHAPAVEGRGLGLELDLPAAPLVCRVDAERVAQVVDNLVSNAAKYTDAGGHILVRLRPEDGGARLDVQDDGVGLAPHEAAHLFEPFARFRPDTTRGLGLGLHLCKAVVEGHGGRIGAASDGTGLGSRFWFWIPTGPAAGPTPG